MPLHQLLYISAAKVPFTEEQLTELVHDARDGNAKRGVTGLLLYSDGHFIQLIEGEVDAVRELASKIKADTRHHEFQQLLSRQSDARLFPDWSMGLASMADMSEEHRAEFSTFIQDVRSGKIQASPDDRAPMKLLVRFASVVGP
ncbi:MAG: BLUF domain-containing protein [Myxococcales bacterium]|nr:BLUF domain-containing protein [Myxococcales bacterium]